MPEVHPPVTEYHRHRLACPHGQVVTGASLPPEVVGGYGRRVPAITAVLAGGHRLGKRVLSQAMGDLFGLSISPAAVCSSRSTEPPPKRWQCAQFACRYARARSASFACASAGLFDEKWQFEKK